jgi:hypothetical protein
MDSTGVPKSDLAAPGMTGEGAFKQHREPPFPASSRLWRQSPIIHIFALANIKVSLRRRRHSVNGGAIRARIFVLCPWSFALLVVGSWSFARAQPGRARLRACAEAHPASCGTSSPRDPRSSRRARTRENTQAPGAGLTKLHWSLEL